MPKNSTMNFLKTAPREAESSTDTTFVFCDCSNIILNLESWILKAEHCLRKNKVLAKTLLFYPVVVPLCGTKVG